MRNTKKILMAAFAATTLFACGHETTSDVERSLHPDTFKKALDGREYCRTMQNDGLFGQPRSGEREHCVSFADGQMTDDANTFFGNPPETLSYQVREADVMVLRDGEWRHAYSIDGETLLNKAGAVLSLTISLDGNVYCRTIETDGTFGQPVGEREHCVSFNDGSMTDNANTFFGNPPETVYYKVRKDEVRVFRGSGWVKDYSIDGETLVNGAGAVLLLVK